MWQKIKAWFTSTEPQKPGGQDAPADAASSQPEQDPDGELEHFLRDVADDEDGLLIHGLGSSIASIPPSLERAQVLARSFDATDSLRSHLCEIVTGSDDARLVHGAVKVLKKVGAGEVGAGDYSGLLGEGLLEVLHRPPLDDALYSDALMLLNYCNATAPVAAADLQRIAERSQSVETESLTKFKAMVRMLDGRWTAPEPTDTEAATEEPVGAEEANAQELAGGDADSHQVLTNGQGLYQIVPATQNAPDGWAALGEPGTKRECEAAMVDQISRDVAKQRGF